MPAKAGAVGVLRRGDRARDLEVSTEEWEVADGDPDRSPSPAAPRPEFRVAFRGYDRASVDEYLEDVNRLIEELESAQTPDAAVKDALDRVGEQTSGILQRAREAEESITARSRARAEERLRDAERTARALRERAEAKVRELDEDNEALWQERQRVLDDLHRLFNQLGRVVAAANRRFPPADAQGQPAPGLDAPQGITPNDSEPELAADAQQPGTLEHQLVEEPVEGREDGTPGKDERLLGELEGTPFIEGGSETADPPSGSLFGAPPAWEDDLRGLDVLEEVGGERWGPPAAEGSIAAYRIENSEDEELDAERP